MGFFFPPLSQVRSVLFSLLNLDCQPFRSDFAHPSIRHSVCLPSVGGSGVPAFRLGHRDPGRHFPGDPEEVLCQVLQSGRQL